MPKSVLIVGGGFAGLTAAVELSSRGHQVTLLERSDHLGGRATSHRDTATGSVIDSGPHFLMGWYTETLAFLDKIGTRDRLLEAKKISMKLPPLPSPWNFLRGFAQIGLGQIALGGPSLRQRLQAIGFGKSLRSLSEAALFFPKVGLSDLYTEAAAQFIQNHGGHIFLKTPVMRIDFHGGQFARREFKEVELEGGRKLEADILLLTVPFAMLRRLIPEAVLYQDSFFHALRNLRPAPILSVHFWFDREVVDWDFVGLGGTRPRWLINKRFQEGPRHLSWVQPEAHEELAIPGPQLVERLLGELRELFPEAQAAKRMHSMVVKEPEAMLSTRVEMDPFRLSQKTPYPNLFLAGDWTNTGLPATIESAVRSAKKAVELIVNEG